MSCYLPLRQFLRPAATEECAIPHKYTAFDPFRLCFGTLAAGPKSLFCFARKISIDGTDSRECNYEQHAKWGKI